MYVIRPSEDVIQRVLDNTATKKEGRIVARWFVTSNGQEYLKTKIEKEKDIFDNVIVNFNKESVLRKINSSISNNKRNFILKKVATLVVALFVFCVTFLCIKLENNFSGSYAMQSIETEVGEKLQLMLQDGSRVYMNPKTKIKFSQNFGENERTIYLDGEAYFDVTKKTALPFIIQTQENLIKVLGTSFLVQSHSDDSNINIILDEGKVAFKTTKNKNHIITSGQKLRFNKANDEVSISQIQHYKFNKKIDRFVIFDEDDLKSVIAKLKRWYNVNFIVKDAKAFSYLFTASFKNSDLKQVLMELEKISPLSFKLDKNTVFITIEK